MNQLDLSAVSASTTVVVGPTSPRSVPSEAFLPREPATLEQAGISSGDVEALVLKQLHNSGTLVGRKIADQIKLPFGLLGDVLRGLKQQLLINYKSQAAMGDFEYELTVEGVAKARALVDRCTYSGAAPVPLKDYIASVEKQTIRNVRPKLADLCHALADLSLDTSAISQIGQAVHAGRGLFLYGQPGNGKTSIAERIIRAATSHIWIPRTITVTGEIIRLFDPASHVEAPPAVNSQLLDTLRYDRRWVRIRRPSIIVGGELRLDQLEIANNHLTGILESPIQLKANCGALIIDDFGRQRMSTDELLNRWIVPLEKGTDYLQLPSGRQIQVPFDPILIFSTNLDPAKLVDEAFLRRIPYKVELADPSPSEFRDLFRLWCKRLEIAYDDDAFDHLLTKAYVETGRPMRYCQPRDLALQVKNFCEFHEQPLALTSKALDVAAKNYFAGL